MSGLQFKDDYSDVYVTTVPAALAFERILECNIYRNFNFVSPVLDLGCGDGLFTKHLFADAIDVGLDPGHGEIRSARETNAYQELICCFGNQIPKANDSFNTVYSNSVLEHIEDLDPVLMEVKRVLKSGGFFYLTVPTDQFEHYAFISRVLTALSLKGMSDKFCRFYNRFWVHYHFHTPEQWAERFGKIGFEVVTQREYAAKNICTLHDVLAYLALPTFLSKKLFHRWIMIPSIRRIYAPFIAAFGRWTRDNLEKTEDFRKPGGLIFFALRKV